MPQYEQIDLLCYLDDMEEMATVEADIERSERLLEVNVERKLSKKECLIKFCSRFLNRLQSFIFSVLTAQYPIKPSNPSSDIKNMKSEDASICLSSARMKKTILLVKQWCSQSALRILKGVKHLQIRFQQRLIIKAPAANLVKNA